MEKSLRTKRLAGWTAILAAVVAMLLHAYLAWEYYQLKLGLAEGHSVCNISSKFNCEVVAISQYASVFNIPMAMWGFWTNGMFLLILLASLIGIGSRPLRLGRLAALLGTGIFAASLVMGFISASLLSTYCLFCIGTYVCSIFALGGSLVWAGQKSDETWMEDIESLFGEAKPLLLFFVAIPAAAWLSNSMMMDTYGGNKMETIANEKVAEWPQNPKQDFDLTKGLVFQAGTSEPKVTIVEFIDVFCPHCKVATPGIHSFVEGRPDTRLVVKIYPLDGVCNSEPGMPKRDGLRCQWSEAVLCSEKMSQKGWPALDWIFENQQLLASHSFDSQIGPFSEHIGLPQAELTKCINDGATQDALVALSAEGVKGKVDGTPTLYLNAQKLELGQFLPVLDKAYRLLKSH